VVPLLVVPLRIKLVTVDPAAIRTEQRFRFLRRAGHVVANAV
jgi:hypothetical protein